MSSKILRTQIIDAGRKLNSGETKKQIWFVLLFEQKRMFAWQINTIERINKMNPELKRILSTNN